MRAACAASGRSYSPISRPARASRRLSASSKPKACSKLSRRLGIAVLLVIATLFGTNHVAARFAIDHGASVAAAVAIRSATTALVLLVLLPRLWKIPLRIDRGTLMRSMLVGGFVAVQSFCLYSAVARIPVALALLVFNLYPMLFMLLSSTAGKEKLRGSGALRMTPSLGGLALALNIRVEGFAGRWEEIGAG